MPLPWGHIAIGLTTADLTRRDCPFRNWKLIVFIAVLANLPDLDVVVGLLLQGNGGAFHRGPSHSVFFAFFAGMLAANAWRIWAKIPQVDFRTCFLAILSHVMGDLFLSDSPVSLLWPLEVHWSGGYSGWGDVLVPVFLRAYMDAGIVIACLAGVILNRVIGLVLQQNSFTSLAYRFSTARPHPQKKQ